MRILATGVVLLTLSAAAAAQDLRGALDVDGEGVFLSAPDNLPRALAEEQVAPPVGPGKHDQTEPSDKYTRRDTVVIQAAALKEEDLVGPYKQPEWTQHRRFATTRVYLQQPAGGVEYEQWLEIRIPKEHGKDNEIRIREEFEFGLGSRFQLDIYLQQLWSGNDNEVNNSLDWRAISFELRYALADWGVIWGNPTLYFEYVLFNQDENTIEAKLLLGDDFGSGWHWGLNFVYERELGAYNFRTEEFKLAAGLSRTIIDQVLSLGIALETSYEAEYDAGVAERSRELLLGPSLQFRPIPKAHIDLEPLFGLTGQSHRMKMFIVFGWDF